MNVIHGSWGPFDTDAEARAAVPEDELDNLESVDELFLYDAYRIAIARNGDAFWLVHTFEDGPDRMPPANGIGRHKYTTHHLRFDSEEAIRATLHDDMIPTAETYEAASEIHRTVFSYDHDGRSRTNSAFTLECAPAQASIGVDDDVIDERLKPGSRMVFANLATDQNPEPRLYRDPIPVDESVYFYDCARAWFGSFPDKPERRHFVTCISDENGEYLEHRFDFPTVDQEAFRCTLAAGVAPTMASYRLAEEVWSQREITQPGDIRTVDVHKIDIYSDDWDKPKWMDADAYAANSNSRG